MKALPHNILQVIDDLVRTLNFEAKTGQRVTLEVSQNVFDIEEFSRRRVVYVNGQAAGEITEEIDPFV